MHQELAYFIVLPHAVLALLHCRLSPPMLPCSLLWWLLSLLLLPVPWCRRGLFSPVPCS